MKILNLKAKVLTTLIGFGGLLTQLVQAQEQPAGTIVPSRISFTEGMPNSSNDLLEPSSLELTNFREFDGQVILVMYHASW